MKIEDCRKQIDSIDKELLNLFSERMDVSAAIAQFKKANNIPVLDLKREKEKINSVVENSPENIRDYS